MAMRLYWVMDGSGLGCLQPQFWHSDAVGPSTPTVRWMRGLCGQLIRLCLRGDRIAVPNDQERCLERHDQPDRKSWCSSSVCIHGLFEEAGHRAEPPKAEHACNARKNVGCLGKRSCP